MSTTSNSVVVSSCQKDAVETVRWKTERQRRTEAVRVRAMREKKESREV